MRAFDAVRRSCWKLAFVVVGALLPAAAARAEPLPLPKDEQDRVKSAIDKGVAFLKTSQLPTGTWPGDGGHPVGYAALSGLALLECGVPKNDPVLLKAEAFIRKALPTMDDTYEVSLSVLFLDRLGNKDDDPMIQGLALRLIAGQSPTGGWGYKVKNLENKDSHDLFKLLHQISPKPAAGKPGAKDSPPADKPAGDPAKPAPDAAPDLTKFPNLSGFVVVKEMAKLKLEDPPDKPSDVIYATTDNSDTQFAILALWAAQRHDVPVERTMRLIANRFQTSQNADGSWGYRYTNGGGQGESPPMDCCGLLGLAVGHGITHGGEEAVNAVKDPRIVNGFAALNKFVGTPANRTHTLPMVNLYFLWALGRMGVLYDLQTIADKDWYRWGAETLVANQGLDGAWAQGGPEGGAYPGATPTINTALALLFLRRTNLAADLTSALKLNSEDLTKAIAAKVVAPAPAPVPPPPPKAPEPMPQPPAPPPPEAEHAAPAPSPAPAPSTMPPPAPTTAASPAPPSEGGVGWLAWVLIALAVLLLTAGGVVLALQLRKRSEPVKVSKNGKKRPADKRPAAAAPPARKPSGKMRPRA